MLKINLSPILSWVKCRVKCNWLCQKVGVGGEVAILINKAIVFTEMILKGLSDISSYSLIVYLLPTKRLLFEAKIDGY